MKSYKPFILIILLLIFVTGISFGQPLKQPKKHPAGPDSKTQVATLSAIDILAGGSSGAIDKPFIFVARDKETYAALKKLVEGLPDKVDFSKNAVVAAFRGTKPTGGYSISFSEDILNDRYIGAKLTILAVDPLPGRPVTDALTSPFKVVLIPVEKEKTLQISAGKEWMGTAETYQVTSGKFEFMGGYAGIRKSFESAGTIAVWRSADLITCAFDLSAPGTEKGRTLSETASGTISESGLIKLPQLDAGSFVDNPRPEFGVKGKRDSSTLSLELASLPTHYGDGYAGHGKLTAIRQK